MAAFKRRRRFEIAYVESLKKFCYVVEFKGKSIERDDIALAYLRASKATLLYYIGTGQYSRMSVAEKDNSRAPYVVYDCETESVPASRLLKYIEGIHCAAERLYNTFIAQKNSQGYGIMDVRWELR